MTATRTTRPGSSDSTSASDREETVTTTSTGSSKVWSKLAKPLTLIAGVALVAGCTSTNATDNPSTEGPTGVVANPESVPEIAADLAAITKKNVAKIAPTRLADGLVPPTNRWFSGLVFGDQPQPVFPMPLSAALTDTGFAIGLPQVTASEKTIMGGNNPQIQVPLGAQKMQVTAYDTLSVTSTYSDASGTALGSVILVQVRRSSPTRRPPTRPSRSSRSSPRSLTGSSPPPWPVTSTAWSPVTAPAWMPAARSP